MINIGQEFRPNRIEYDTIEYNIIQEFAIRLLKRKSITIINNSLSFYGKNLPYEFISLLIIMLYWSKSKKVLITINHLSLWNVVANFI